MSTQKEINEKYSEILEYKNYLVSTDYMIIKSAETGYEVPSEVLTKRQEARVKTNNLLCDINKLEAKLKQETFDNDQR